MKVKLVWIKFVNGLFSTLLSSSSSSTFQCYYCLLVHAPLLCVYLSLLCLSTTPLSYCCVHVLMDSLTLLLPTADPDSGSEDSYAAVPRRHSAGSSNSNPAATDRYRLEDSSHSCHWCFFFQWTIWSWSVTSFKVLRNKQENCELSDCCFSSLLTYTVDRQEVVCWS